MHRVGRWVFIGVQVIFLVWMISAIVSTANAHPPATQYLNAQTARQAAQIGGGIAVAAIVAFWVAVDVIAGVTYFIVKHTRKS